MHQESISALADVFDRAAEDYDRTGAAFFTPLGRRLVERARIAPGSRILDVGCGSGACLFPAARATGPDGRVMGIDLAPAMVDRAREEAKSLGLGHVSVEIMDALHPAFPTAHFDVVLSSMVLVWLPDSVNVLERYRPLLKPGGKLVYCNPKLTAGDGIPFVPKVFETVMESAGVRPKSFFEGLDNGWLGDPEEALLKAGYHSVDVCDEPYALELRSGDDWVRWSWSHGFRSFWEQIPQDRLAGLEAQVAVGTEALRDADGVIRVAGTVRHVSATA
ncbi:class I SAM-dependent methyltransferase [Streptomyces blattellae]|uniref:class I SAM-dependent methyltransferase n=1 Tax=Streptomyces blattellae TaxID=2569855 RepID=UPI0018AC9E6C|nr:class I SAM-dependent methyltransferase [Streptomyces blattellae]